MSNIYLNTRDVFNKQQKMHACDDQPIAMQPIAMQPTAMQTQTVHVVTNGYLNFGYNYILMFKTKEEALTRLKNMGLSWKIAYNYFELVIPAHDTSINVMITQTCEHDIVIARIKDQSEFVQEAFSYYAKIFKDENADNNRSEGDLRKMHINSHVIFNDEHIYFQMFGSGYKNSFCFVSNVMIEH